MTLENTGIGAQEVINEAKAEIRKELNEKNKTLYKTLLKKQLLARTALENISREIEDAEAAMRQGNNIVS